MSQREAEMTMQFEHLNMSQKSNRIPCTIIIE